MLVLLCQRFCHVNHFDFSVDPDLIDYFRHKKIQVGFFTPTLYNISVLSHVHCSWSLAIQYMFLNELSLFQDYKIGQCIKNCLQSKENIFVLQISLIVGALRNAIRTMKVGSLSNFFFQCLNLVKDKFVFAIKSQFAVLFFCFMVWRVKSTLCLSCFFYRTLFSPFFVQKLGVFWLFFLFSLEFIVRQHKIVLDFQYVLGQDKEWK